MSQNIRPVTQPNEPELIDLLDLFKRDIFLSLNCHHLATVEKFNPVTQTATVTINYKKVVTQLKPGAPSDNIMPVSVSRDYPVIADVPVIFLGGGNGALTMPVKKGDECLLLFNDRNIDNWFNGSRTSQPATGRMHAFTDAIALVGVRSLRTAIKAFNPNEPEFRSADGTVKVTIKTDSVVVTAGLTTLEINKLGKFKVQNQVGEFVTALLQVISSANIPGVGPVVVDPTALATLTTFKDV